MPSSLGARIVARDHQVGVDSHDHRRRGSDDDFVAVDIFHDKNNKYQTQRNKNMCYLIMDNKQ